jgi:hypothetical protein
MAAAEALKSAITVLRQEGQDATQQFNKRIAKFGLNARQSSRHQRALRGIG